MPNVKGTHTEPLPLVAASAIDKRGRFACQHCKGEHEVFYKRHDRDKRTLHYFCSRVKHYWYENGNEHFRTITALGKAEFVPGLPVREEWTPACRKAYQKNPWNMEPALL